MANKSHLNDKTYTKIHNKFSHKDSKRKTQWLRILALALVAAAATAPSQTFVWEKLMLIYLLGYSNLCCASWFQDSFFYLFLFYVAKTAPKKPQFSMELAIFFSVAIQKHPFNNVWHIVWDKKAIYLCPVERSTQGEKEKKMKMSGIKRRWMWCSMEIRGRWWNRYLSRPKTCSTK